MNRGRGVTRQKVQDGGLSDARVHVKREGLTWRLGKKTRTETDLKLCIGQRAQADKLSPNGFRRTISSEVYKYFWDHGPVLLTNLQNYLTLQEQSRTLGVGAGSNPAAALALVALLTAFRFIGQLLKEDIMANKRKKLKKRSSVVNCSKYRLGSTITHLFETIWAIGVGATAALVTTSTHQRDTSRCPVFATARSELKR